MPYDTAQTHESADETPVCGETKLIKASNSYLFILSCNVACFTIFSSKKKSYKSRVLIVTTKRSP